jgi:hypothetical protein
MKNNSLFITINPDNMSAVKTAITVMMSLGAQIIFGQDNETLRTARPGQAVGPFTTGQYIFQAQSGLTYGGHDLKGSNETGNRTVFGLSTRYGILEDLEIRTAIRWRSDRVNLQNRLETKTSGSGFWKVGVRYNIVNASGYKPSFGIQTDFKLNWVDQVYQAQEIAPRFMLIHGQKLSDIFSLTTNWAVAWNGNDNVTKGLYALNIAFPLSDKLGGFIENYGELINGNLDTRWDTGIGYSVGTDLQLDVSAGFGNNTGMDDWFVDTGISWRIKVK